MEERDGGRCRMVDKVPRKEVRDALARVARTRGLGALFWEEGNFARRVGIWIEVVEDGV